MNDKTLLELAAKAIGLKYHAFVNAPFIGYGLNIGDLETPIWNPLTDDGDALRLAVKLHLSMDLFDDFIDVSSTPNDNSIFDIKVPALPDPYAATRKAITRAAAEIGRAL